MTDPSTADASTQGRAHWFRPDELDGPQRELYDAITSSPRASGPRRAPLVDPEGRLNGPFNPLLYSPSLGDPLQRLGSAVRYESSLGDGARELAILLVARARSCDYEWLSHAPIARSAGLSDDQLEALLDGAVPAGLDEEEQAVHDLAETLLSSGDLDDATFAHFTEALGPQRLSEVVILVGYYSLLATSMRVWQTPLPPGMDAVFGPR